MNIKIAMELMKAKEEIKEGNEKMDELLRNPEIERYLAKKLKELGLMK